MNTYEKHTGGVMVNQIPHKATYPAEHSDNRSVPTMPQRISPRGAAILGCALPRARIHRPPLPLRFFNLQLSTV